MTEYALYLESGPKMKTTMVHVFDLLGCIANGPTTEAALEATPGEIRQFLAFLQRHGENVDPDAPFTTKIAAHVTEGSWIGQGDPAPGFAPDFEPLTREDESAYRRRFQWLGEEVVALIGQIPDDELPGKPSKGRVLPDIVTHIANSEPEYLRASGIGKPEGVKEALQAIESAEAGELASRLTDLWQLLDAQIERITPDVRTAQIQRGEKLWTGRRGFRRALEHPWEHLREMQRRLGGDHARG
jgi:predicted RNase H-like HicB family nuclease